MTTTAHRARTASLETRPPLGVWRKPRLEQLAEHAIAGVAASAVVAIALIFAFVLREALPILWDHGPDFQLRDLVWARAWKGYAEPEHVWQPVGYPPKYDLVPLAIGTLKITSLAMFLSVPLGVLAALYVALFARSRVRAIVKPAIELLAGVPSVVLGFVGLTWVADATHAVLGTEYRLNALVAAMCLSVAVVPVIFTISDDALRAVPVALREASFALGARSWQTALRVVIPSAMPGIVAAVVLGFGRAVGETMIVLMASGNAAVTSASPTSSARTLTATIAAELGEAPRGGEHWRVLFLLGAVLLVVTFVLDRIGQSVTTRLRKRLHAGASA